MIRALALCLLGQMLNPSKAAQICETAPAILSAANEYDVSPITLLCVAQVETKWDSSRIGSSGECGVAQVLPGRRWGCRSLQSNAVSMDAAGYILRPGGFFSRIAKSGCGGSPSCIRTRTLMGYNAGTAAARGKGRRLARATRYARAISACEVKMGIFNSLLLDHKELEDKTKVQPRDYVYFFSRAGGWGFGHVVQAKKKLKENEVCVLKTGRSKPEVVKMSDIQHAFRENADQQL